MLQVALKDKMTKSQVKKDHAYTLIVGIGVTGLSVVRYLYELGEKIIVVDSRDIPPAMNILKQEYPDIVLHTGKFEEDIFINARRIVVSPGVPLSEPVLQSAKEHGVEITGDIDLFAREAEAPVVGITGSNGKSTVTTLLTAMIKNAGINVSMGGNIGTPVLDILSDETELYVLELSSFQLETLANLPMKVAVVLNISSDHQDRYADLASYALSKQVIYENAENLVVNKDDSLAGKNLPPGKPVTGFTLKVPDEHDFGLRYYEGEPWLCRGQERLLPAASLKIKGQHNISNALAALAMGSLLNIPLKSMLNVLETFSGLEHRTQWVADVDGVHWFNDSKATNVGASIAAIEGLPGTHVLIAGGEGKQADFSPLKQVAKEHLRAAVLIGRDANIIEEVLSGVVKVVHAKDMDDAVKKAAELAQPGDNVLLSLACASFDMFQNFEQRGAVFMRSVKECSK
jgi:UDP-N-acetylmuramoylalanine--D-glutamate ligase